MIMGDPCPEVSVIVIHVLSFSGFHHEGLGCRLSRLVPWLPLRINACEKASNWLGSGWVSLRLGEVETLDASPKSALCMTSAAFLRSSLGLFHLLVKSRDVEQTSMELCPNPATSPDSDSGFLKLKCPVP